MDSLFTILKNIVKSIFTIVMLIYELFMVLILSSIVRDSSYSDMWEIETCKYREEEDEFGNEIYTVEKKGYRSFFSAIKGKLGEIWLKKE